MDVKELKKRGRETLVLIAIIVVALLSVVFVLSIFINFLAEEPHIISCIEKCEYKGMEFYELKHFPAKGNNSVSCYCRNSTAAAGVVFEDSWGID